MARATLLELRDWLGQQPSPVAVFGRLLRSRTCWDGKSEFDEEILKIAFEKNFHVRYPSVFEQRKDDLVPVKGGPGSRLLRKAYQISVEGKGRRGKPLTVLSPDMQKVFGTFGGRIAIQRNSPRWVEAGYIDKATGCFLKDLE